MQDLPPLPSLTDGSADARVGASATASTLQAREIARLHGAAVRTQGSGGIGEQFEASVMVPLLAAILPPEDNAVWGGSAGRMWRGLFAEQLATATVEAGGFGIASMIEAALASRAATNAGEEG